MKSVFFTENVGEAYRVREALIEAGIGADVANELLSAARGELPLGLTTMPTVWIADEARAGEAQEIIRKLHEPSTASAWNCSKCGEALDGAFTACWNCGAERG